ncbi:MAG: TRAP transporter large permease [Planctomycetota bacterium]|jgi:C4-dicarboxylate transporter DctM subunit|nr:TRAP transporter large permease [Planctomycetota bacterium]
MEALGIYLGLFGVLFVLGIPIVLALALAAVLMLLMNDVSLIVFAQKFIVSLDNYSLTAMLFFILAGEVMNGGGMTRRIVGAVSKVVRNIPGGLAIVAVVSCGLFAAINGSAIATAVAIGAILYPAMVKQGYPPAFAAAVIAAGGVVGPIIPPSIPMIVYGSTTGDSIAALFAGGMLLGVLIVAGEIIAVYLISKRRGYGREVALELGSNKGIVWALAFPALIFGVIVGGIMTATEASALAVAYAWFVGTFIYREFKFREFPGMMLRAMKSSGTIMAIVGAATAVAWVLTYERVPQTVTETMVSHLSSPMAFMAVTFGLLFFVGMIMDLTPAILILTPIFIEPVRTFGVDPIYFGVFFCSVLTAGLITPPVGTLIYLGCSTSGKTFAELVRELLPFVLAIYAAIFLVVFFPDIVTWIPHVLLKLY